MHGFKIGDGEGCKIEDCFFHPTEWDDDSKKRYTKWLARMPESHPSKANPRPWEWPG